MRGSEIKKCKDCAYFALASEGLDEDVCTFYSKALSREEVIKATECPKFELRKEEKDLFFAKYEAELKKYLPLMLILLVLGVVLLYIITR